MLKEKEIEKLKEDARKRNIREGIFNSAKNSLGTEYVPPFAIAINSSNSLVALLSSLPGLLGPLSQIISSNKLKKISRKKIVRNSILLESFVWLFFFLTCILFSKNILTPYLPMLVLILFSGHEIFSNILYPAWFSWTGDLIDKKYRGRWFSKRNLIMGTISIILVFSSSFLLDFLKEKGMNLEGFMLLFFLAFIFRILSYNSIKNSYEPKIKIKKSDYFSFWQFLKKAPNNNFGRFVIYRSLIAFSSSISSSLLAIYLLRNLRFNYTEYMILIFAGTFFSLLCIEIWGKIADRHGNYAVIHITSIFLSTTPILWILHPSFIYLLIVPSLIEGISGAGFNLATSNFIYDNVKKEKRGIAVSYYLMIRGIGIFLGAGLGAILIKYWTISIIQPIIAIFIISGIIRMIIVFFLLGKIKELKIKKAKKKNSLEKISLTQTKTILSKEFHDIISIKKYFKD